MNIEKSTLYYLELFVTDTQGEPVTGQTNTYTIYRCSDNSVVTSGTLTEIGGGMYQSSYTFNELGQFRILYNTPPNYEDVVEYVLVEEPHAKQAELLRGLGLMQENFRIFNPIYNSNGDLVSSYIKIYPTAADCDADTNAIAQYQVRATYNATSEMTSYKVKRTA